MLDFRTFVLLCGVIFFVRAARSEQASPLIWGGCSLAVSVIIMALGGGILLLVVGQVAVFLAITVIRVLMEKQ